MTDNPNRFSLLESGTKEANYNYLKVQGATHQEANALILATWGKKVRKPPARHLSLAAPVRKPSHLAIPRELAQTHGIPKEQFIQVGGKALKFTIFETGSGLWVSRLKVCRALNLADSFLSRLAPTAEHTHSLERLGYTGEFRRVEDVINGGPAARCISLKNAEIAIGVLAGRGKKRNAA
jgi:hypothetical protein